MKATKLLLCLTAALCLTFMVSCEKEKEETKTPVLYFMDSSDEIMEKMVLDGTNSITTIKHLAEMSGVGIAYDNKHKKLFFSDFFDEDTPNGKIWKMNLDSSDAVAIVSGLLNPFGIALDTKNNKIYWGDENGNVSRCNLDGSSVETGIVNIDGGAIRALALDLTNNKLYFYEVMNNNLYKANLDGSNATVILNGYYGYGLYVDEVNSKIYFDAQTDDESVSALYRANLDGTDPVEIDNTQSRIYGIAIDTENNKLYWSARDNGEIYSASLNGTGKVTLATGLSSPRGIVLVK
jgi:DNA-binding beta-propeller fold protein YncE